MSDVCFAFVTNNNVFLWQCEVRWRHSILTSSRVNTSKQKNVHWEKRAAKYSSLPAGRICPRSTLSAELDWSASPSTPSQDCFPVGVESNKQTPALSLHAQIGAINCTWRRFLKNEIKQAVSETGRQAERNADGSFVAHCHDELGKNNRNLRQHIL